MGSHDVNGPAAMCGWGTERRMLPEAELWTEVILQALDDLNRRTSSASGSAQDSARRWFASKNDDVGSFLWSCGVIDIDPTWVRSVVERQTGTQKRHNRRLA
jgi:hypothetical protein